MARHRKCAAPVPLDRARRRLAVGLTAASALAATFLAVTVTPAAPPAPDRTPAKGSSDLAQASGK
ncbi:hypothetical protein ACFYZ9_20120 [Streptomyces sp. NPDC001691]|uniref:hypothetical protein n=1 Tax=unclassified Streptomyces TaxID=2593676 RepID=UPI0011C042A9|nr:hypothetical protein [Streptomyces sp. SDr-06]